MNNDELEITESFNTLQISKGDTSFHIDLSQGKAVFNRRRVTLTGLNSTLDVNDKALSFTQGALLIIMLLNKGEAQKIIEAIKDD